MGKYKYTGLFVLIVILIYCIIFYQERTMYIDPAMQLFDMINFEKYSFFVGRYSMVVNQTLPLLAILAHAPLKWVLLLYSVSPALIFLVIYYVVVFRWKQEFAGFAMVSMFLVMGHAFVHSISETMLGIAYSTLFLGWINYYDPKTAKKTAIFFLVMISIILLNFFIHPVTVFTLGAAWLWTMETKNKWRDPKYWIVPLIIIAPYIYKFMFPYSDHEESFFAGLKNADELLPRFWSLKPMLFLGKRFFNLYIIPSILSLVLFLYFMIFKKYRQAFFMYGTLIGFFVINTLIFSGGDSELGMESRYLPTMFLVMVPFGAYILKEKWLNNIMFLLFAGLCLKALFNIYHITKKNYSVRIAYMQEIIDEASSLGKHKVILEYNEVAKEKLTVNYAIAVESMLYSSNKGDTYTIFLTEDYTALDANALANPKSFFWVPWWIYADGNMPNKKYFNLPDEPYIYIGKNHP